MKINAVKKKIGGTVNALTNCCFQIERILSSSLMSFLLEGSSVSVSGTVW